ncbi:hypothetical protein MASR2M18_07870 [Ignavibacteria bacterium]|nr:exo-alpha-sialidase [Bacteroidota bacterium]MCZ2132815.1 hypothetical protein [Bacteroidota bacterium]
MKKTHIFIILILILGIIFSNAVQLSAQMNWREITAPRSAVQFLFVTQSGVVLAFDSGTFYRSSDAGASWSENTDGFPKHQGTDVEAIVESTDGTLWTVLRNVADSLIFRSDDDGLTWEPLVFSVGDLHGKLSALHHISGRFYGTFRYQTNGRDTVRIVVADGQPVIFSLLDAPQGIDLMASGNILFGRTTEKTPGYTDKYPLWEFSPQTGQWMKIFTPTYNGNGNYPNPTYILALPSGERFIAATEGSFVRQNLYYSPDAGKTWQMLFQTKFGSEEKRVNALIPLDNENVAMLFDFHTDTNIDTLLIKKDGKWTLAPLTRLSNRRILKTAGSDADGNIYIHSNCVLKLAPDDRTRWVDCGLPDDFIEQTYADSSNQLFVRYRNGMLHRSNDDGATWSSITDNLPRKQGELSTADALIIADDNAAYIRIDNRLLVSRNAGKIWNEISAGISGIRAVYADRTRIFAADTAVLLEISAGVTVGNSISHPFGEAVTDSIGFFMKLRNGSYLLRVGGTNIFRISSDNGQLWTDATFTAFPIKYKSLTNPIEMPDGTLYTILCYNIFDGRSIYRSTDGGSTWDRIAFGRVFSENATHFTLDRRANTPYIIDGANGIVRLTPLFDGTTNLGPKAFGLKGLTFNGNNEIYTCDAEKIYKGTPAPDATNWERTGSTYLPSKNKYIISITSKTNNDVWLASLQAGALRSVDNGIFWSSRNLGIGILNTRLFTDSKDIIFVCTNNGLYRCVDGYTWEESANGIPLPMFVYDMLEDSIGRFYAATFGDGIYRSLDRGNSWEKFSYGIRNDFTRGLAMDSEGNIFAATNGGIYAMFNKSDVWTDISGTLGEYISGEEIETAFDNIYCYTDRKLQRVEHKSTIWQAEFTQATINSLYRDRAGRLLACTKDGLWIKHSADGSWDHFGFAGKEVFSVGENAMYYFAGLDDDRVYRLSKGATGTQEATTVETHGIFPNPAREYITIMLPADVAEIAIINALGSVIARYESFPFAEYFHCPVEDLYSGAYSVRILRQNRTTITSYFVKL